MRIVIVCILLIATSAVAAAGDLGCLDYGAFIQIFGAETMDASGHDIVIDNDLAYVAHGENADDAVDATRVGHRAAEEQGIVAPLQEAGLCKAEIRELSRRRNLPTSDKPSMACLSTRVPTGTRLTVADLARIERAEAALKGLGFRQYRARHHGDLCRIELEPADLERAAAPETRAAIVRALSALGYRHVTLDLAGYGTRADPLD